MLRAWRMRARCRTPDQPWAWVGQITRNEAHRLHSRRAATHELPTDRLPEAHVDEEEQDAVARLDLRSALDRLSPTDRLMVLLRYESDMTHTAVAAALGLSVANVKVRLHRLKPKLRQTLV